MFERQPLRTPITLGVVMIVMVVTLAVIWIVTSVLWAPKSNVNFWIPLAIGGVLLAAVLAGVIAYLTLTVKAVNLNRRQSNFIDSVTHELKSPIASLKLYLQTMTRHDVDEAERENFHRFMLDDVERLDTLINHLLDVARVQRVDAADAPAGAAEFRVDSLLSECAAAACLRYSLPDATVTIDSPSILVRQSRVQAEILFRNLIDNAIKYGGTPPRVDIHVTSDETHVTVTVEDNGGGIPESQRRNVFGRFVRLGDELERKRQGTGLGLYLVRTVTKSLGGSVRIDDVIGGEGSRFEVRMALVSKRRRDRRAAKRAATHRDSTS